MSRRYGPAVTSWLILNQTVVAMLLTVCGAGLAVRAPQRVLAQAEPDTEVNVELVMDSSGSMASP